MKTVAERPALNQAVADLSDAVRALLQQAHDGSVRDDMRAAAAHHLRRLRELVRRTGVELNELPAWHLNIANWRALARLAGSAVTSNETSRAG